MTREPLRFTLGRWFNKLRDDGGWSKAPAYREGFTYDGFAYGSDTPEQFTPETPVQYSIICSPATGVLAIDVDYPENLASSRTGEHVSWQDAVSSRGGHFHVLVDMRDVEPQDWPVQGRTAWGDVKAAGFVPWPGSVHYSGEQYAAAGDWQSRVVTCTPELAAALRADRDEHALRRLAEARGRLGLSTGTRLPDGAYLYASGYVGGTWDQLPDGALCHDDELKDLVWDMHVEYGIDEADVRKAWERLAGALGKPWTERDFSRHWHRVPARRAEVLEKDDATRLMEDFGLKLPATALESDYARQWREYEERCNAAPSGPPTIPPPGWGFEHTGIDYFTLWLGDGVFDAGRPNDADNALAVLSRSHGVLRYDEEAGTWLLRGTGKWSSFTGPSGPRAVINGLRMLMPEGCAEPLKHPRFEHLDPEADAAQISALKVHAKNRERFSASAQVGAVAAVMTDTVLRHRGAGSVVRSSQLDADKEILWAGGVPWDLRNSLRQPVMSALDRGTPHLMTAPVVPDMSVPTPLWDAYCQAVFPDLPDEQCQVWGDKPESGREWALNVFAACFTGYADALMPVLLGETRLGKTFLVNLLTSVLGDYGGVMSGDLLKSDARLHGSFTLKLKGMRLAFVDEAPGKGAASQEHLKKITGGGRMEGNKMRENPVEFFPTHTLVLATNESPKLTDPALRARARMIRFEGDRGTVKAAALALGGSVDSPRWRAEMPGVLAQMMARAAAWIADRGIADTERAPRLWQMWTDEIAAEQDSLTGWLHSGEVTYEEHPGTSAEKLHQHYVSWCKSHGAAVELDRIAFGIRLHQAGYVPRKTGGNRWWPLKIIAPGVGEFMGRPTQGGTVDPTIPRSFPGTFPTQNPSSDSPDSFVRDGRDSSPPTNTYNAHTHAHTQEAEPGTYPSLPSRLPSARADLRERRENLGEDQGQSIPPAEGEPVVVDLAVLPEMGEIAENAKIADSPPKPKTPRKRLSDEERLERAEARKAKLAAERLDARSAKIAELGGKLVTLPAVVLRDQRIIELDSYGAMEWLEPCLPELSVDVEHSGFPRAHKDYALRLVQLGNEHSAVVFDPSEASQAAAIRHCLSHAKVLHAHSALADLIPLEAAGLGDRTMWDRLMDTVNLAKLIDPALCDSDEAALKPLAKAVLGRDYALSWQCDEQRKALFLAGGWLTECEVTTPVERSGWANVPMCETFVRYAGSDVMDCSAVWRVLRERSMT